LNDEAHVYNPLLDLSDADIIGFDPLQDRLRERAKVEQPSGDGTLTLLPYAIGDGAEHTLYVLNEDASSSLYPLDAGRIAHFNHLSTFRVQRTETITTHRLDDVLPPGPVDFLKLDVQGSELAVLQSAEKTLAGTGVVHCEAEFSPIYDGQPLFPAIQERLNGRGFYLVDIVDSCRYAYLNSRGIASLDRLIWANAVFFRESDERAVLTAQALIAACVYQKPSMAAHLLDLAHQSLS
jgi:FkbM family methyltransferase